MLFLSYASRQTDIQTRGSQYSALVPEAKWKLANRTKAHWKKSTWTVWIVVTSNTLQTAGISLT